jgi:uncharacterized coiled-coil protein SlyX
MDVEKTMEFILSVQARLESSVQQHEERLAKLESSMATATDLIGRLAQAETHLTQRVADLADHMDSGFRELRETQAAGFKELREAQTATDYKLNALIDTVDKIVRKNGHEKS